MNTPKTPRHPSNGYEIGSPIETLVSPVFSPQRRRSLRLSPAKKSLVNGVVDTGDVKVKKRRRSLRLQQIQESTGESPVVVQKKKRRQSGHFGVAKAADATMKDGSAEGSESKKKRRQSKCFGVASNAKSDHMPEVKPVSTFRLSKEAEAELLSALKGFTSTFLTTILEEHELDSNPPSLHSADELSSQEDSKLNDSLDSEDEKENHANKLTISAIKRKKGRRDTFDLSRKRGLRVGPSVLEAPTPFKTVHEVIPVKAGLKVDTSQGDIGGDDELNKALFITPKNSEVNHDVVAETTRTLRDDPQNNVQVDPEVEARMEELDSVVVEARMKDLFGELKIYNYVSTELCARDAHLVSTSNFFCIHNIFSHVSRLESFQQ